MSSWPFDFFWPFFGVYLLVLAVFLAFQIWMLIDAVQRPAELFSPPDSRTWWIVGLAVGLVLGFVGFAAAVVYHFLVRKPAAEGRIVPPPVCPACGMRQRPGARFCSNCGLPIAQERP